MSNFKYAVMLTVFASLSATAQESNELEPPTVVSLVSMEMEDIPGKEALMITVEYPPGGGDPVHRHEAHAFIYVLEGSIIMQVEGSERVTLSEGQTYYEGPNDLHTVGQNASGTEPAKFLVLLVKDVGVAPVQPAE